MSANKIIPVVIAGGALYYYDQNVNPIISRSFHQAPEKKTQATSTVEQVKQETKQIGKSFENQYNRLENKTNELYQKIPSFNVNGTKEQAKKEFDDKKTELTNNDNIFKQGIASYFDWVNSIGGSARYEANLKSQKDTKAKTWFTWASKQADDSLETFDLDKAKTINEYKKTKLSLDELVKEYQNKHLTKEQQENLDKARKSFNQSLTHLQNYGSDLVDSINDSLNQTTNSWWKWGNKKGDELSDNYDAQKQKAIKQYESSKKKFDELSLKIGNKSKAEKDDYLKDAQKDLNKCLTNLQRFGNDVVDETNAKFQEQKTSWSNWTSKQQDKASDIYEDEKQRALKKYEKASKKFSELSRQIEESNPLATKKERDDQLKAAQEDLNESFTNLKKFGNDWANQVLDKINK